MKKKILTALITPFDNDFHIDFPALQSIIKQQMDNGADGFIVCGTTSEAPTLTMDEQTEIIETVLSMTKGNYLVYAGAGTNCTATTISNIHAWNHFDLDGYLLTTPYYNRPSEEGLYHHFALAAASTDKEIMLYHIPSRTASSISLSLAKRLVKDCPNIRSIKYADADYPVFEGLTLSINKGERIALSGKNGSGKSTLIKMILKKSDWDDIGMAVSEEGVCETASGLVISYVGQDATGLKGDITSFCREHDLDKSLFCAILKQLDFERVQFLKNMEDYSEGQKKKILLAASLSIPAHLYIWDEPLNYIDVFSRMQLEKLLLKYQPTMLFVEHDVRFCEKIATRTIEL